MGLEISSMEIHQEESGSHLLGLTGKHQYLDQLTSEIRVLCVASTAAETESEEDQMARLSA